MVGTSPCRNRYNAVLVKMKLDSPYFKLRRVFGLPDRIFGTAQCEYKLFHIMEVFHSFCVDPGRRIGLRSAYHELAKRKCYLADLIIASELVPIQNGELHFESLLVLANMEQQLFLPLRVQRVADDTGTENLFAEGYDDERVHVPHHASH